MDSNFFQQELFQKQKLDAITQVTRAAAHDLNNTFAVIVSSVELANAILKDENLRVKKALNNVQIATERGVNMIKHLRSIAYSSVDLVGESFDLSFRLKQTASLIARSLRIEEQNFVQISENLPTAILPFSQLDLTLLNIAFALKEKVPSSSSLIFKVELIEQSDVQEKSDITIPQAFFQTINQNQKYISISLQELKSTFKSLNSTQVIKGPGIEKAIEQANDFISSLGGFVYTKQDENLAVYLFLPYSQSFDKQTVVQTTDHFVDNSFALKQSDHLQKSNQSNLNKSSNFKNSKLNQSEFLYVQSDVQSNFVESDLNILVVDDDQAVAETAAMMLEEQGFNVRVVYEATSAIDLLASGQTVDLVFSDIVMPGMNGVDLAKKIKIEYPKVPVLLTSGYNKFATGNDMSVFPLIPKPYHFKDLVQKIQSILQPKPVIA